MLGLLSAFVLSTMCIGAWANADAQEHRDKNNSKNKGYDFYFDKNGRMRHTNSGRKFTQEEIHQAYFPESLEEKYKKIDKKIEEDNKKFWAVNTPGSYNITEIELFLTKEEAEKYLQECKEQNMHIIFDYVYVRTKFQIELMEKCGDKIHKHF